MNKSDLIDTIAASTGNSKVASAEFVNAFLGAVTGALARGDSVSIPGFGVFEVRSREARQGRNPATGEPITIAASKTPAFRPGKALKDAL